MRKLTKRIISCIIIYAIILASTFYALKFILYYLNFLHADIDNTRYLLSAIAQFQAAIIAIVITVSLVAVQLAASTYSARVVNIFKTNPDFWLLLILYTGSTLYDCLILMILSRKISTFYIFISYWLCASAILALFPYVLSMINILNPEVIMRKLLDYIDYKSRSTKKEGYLAGSRPLVYYQYPERDPFQPVIDIVRGAFIKGDYETAKIGLRMMTTKVIEIINSCNVEKYKFIPGKQNPYNPYKDFSEHYCGLLGELGEFFAERDEELTLLIILSLGEVAEVITKKMLETELYVIDALGRIGKTSAQKGFQTATEKAMDTIGSIVGRLPCDLMVVPKEYDLHIEEYIYEYIHHRRETLKKALHALDDIGVIAVRRWGAYELQAVSRNLEKIGMKIAMEADKWESIWELLSVARAFNRVGITALNIEENPTQITDSILYRRVIQPLKVIASIISTPWFLFSWDEVPGEHNWRLEEFLFKVFGIPAVNIKKANNGMTIKVNEEVYGLSPLSLDLNSEKTEVELKINNRKTAKLCAKLEDGKINVYCRNEKLTIREDGLRGFEEFVFALWDVGSYAMIRGFKESAKESAKALAELAVIGEKEERVVEERLNNLKHKHKHTEMFIEAYKAYKNQLKELRLKNES